MKAIKLILFSLTLMSLMCFNKTGNTMPQQFNGYVPDEKTAITIAEAVWLPIFGDKIYDSKPFLAELDSTILVWTVKGTLNAYKGGVPYTRIQKMDGKILTVYHTR